MAKGEIVEPKEIVKANNEFFRCKYKIKDVVAGRIFMAFASLVDHKDVKENQSFVEYRITADSILPDTCMGGDNYKQLHDAARSLIDQKIELRINEKEFYFYTLFSKIGYKDGIIIGEFHKDLMPFFLIAKERFTKMKLSEYMKLPSIYSQCIFGFLKSWDDRPKIAVKLTELHNMLDVPLSFRKDFYEFKRRVLEKAHKDINEKTELRYEWKPIKTGRAVTEIEFTFLKKTKTTDNKRCEEPDYTPAKKLVQERYMEFLRKFPNPNAYRRKAWSEWSRLDQTGMAPTPQDVGEGELDPLEFLKRWAQRVEK